MAYKHPHFPAAFSSVQPMDMAHATNDYDASKEHFQVEVPAMTNCSDVYLDCHRYFRSGRCIHPSRSCLRRETKSGNYRGNVREMRFLTSRKSRALRKVKCWSIVWKLWSTYDWFMTLTRNPHLCQVRAYHEVWIRISQHRQPRISNSYSNAIRRVMSQLLGLWVFIITSSQPTRCILKSALPFPIRMTHLFQLKRSALISLESSLLFFSPPWIRSVYSYLF